MIRQTAVVGIAALGMTMVVILGGIDLSVGSMVAFTTVVVAYLLQAGTGPVAAALGGVLVAALCGPRQRPAHHRPARDAVHRHAGRDGHHPGAPRASRASRRSTRRRRG